MCGTDIHIAHGAFPPPTTCPIVPGHELAGGIVSLAAVVKAPARNAYTLPRGTAMQAGAGIKAQVLPNGG